jgi:hypothetical protein
MDYFGKTSKDEDFILSIKFNTESNELTCILRSKLKQFASCFRLFFKLYLYRTKDGNTILSDFNLKEVSLVKILNKLNESIIVKEIKPVLHPLVILAYFYL